LNWLQVTVPCEDGVSVVARSGSLSTFAALEQCCPGSTRDNNTFKGRRGLTMIEYNKTLEHAGFQKVRDRRTELERRAPVEQDKADSQIEGHGLFRFRKWRVADSDRSKWELYKSWELLVESFPLFGDECSWTKFFAVVSRFEADWQPYSETGRTKLLVPCPDAFMETHINSVASLINSNNSVSSLVHAPFVTSMAPCSDGQRPTCASASSQSQGMQARPPTQPQCAVDSQNLKLLLLALDSSSFSLVSSVPSSLPAHTTSASQKQVPACGMKRPRAMYATPAHVHPSQSLSVADLLNMDGEATLNRKKLCAAPNTNLADITRLLHATSKAIISHAHETSPSMPTITPSTQDHTHPANISSLPTDTVSSSASSTPPPPAADMSRQCTPATHAIPTLSTPATSCVPNRALPVESKKVYVAHPKMVTARSGLAPAGCGYLGGTINMTALQQLQEHLSRQEKVVSKVTVTTSARGGSKTATNGARAAPSSRHFSTATATSLPVLSTLASCDRDNTNPRSAFAAGGVGVGVGGGREEACGNTQPPPQKRCDPLLLLWQHASTL